MRRTGALACLAAAVLIAGCGSAAGTKGHTQAASVTKSVPAQASFGPFAGYTEAAEVRSLSAVLTVPRILSGSGNGVAAGWIGATGELTGKMPLAPFIQVGVNEVRGPVGGKATRDMYFAFWSDAAAGFHPLLLFDVKSGDRLRVGLAHTGRRWSVSVVDQTSGRHVRFSTAQEGRASFVAAQWTQEDVSNAATSSQLPYPHLGTTRFSQLELNGRPPLPARAQMTWMSTAAGTFGPSPLHASAFVIEPRHPSAEGLRYQAISLAEDDPGVVFGTDLASWSARTPASTIRRASLRFAQIVGQNIESLRSESWSSGASAVVARLVAASRNAQRIVRDLASAPRRLRWARRELLRETVVTHRLSLTLRARLHIPVFSQSTGVIDKYVRSHPG